MKLGAMLSAAILCCAFLIYVTNSLPTPSETGDSDKAVGTPSNGSDATVKVAEETLVLEGVTAIGNAADELEESDLEDIISEEPSYVASDIDHLSHSETEAVSDELDMEDAMREELSFVSSDLDHRFQSEIETATHLTEGSDFQKQPEEGVGNADPLNPDFNEHDNIFRLLDTIEAGLSELEDDTIATEIEKPDVELPDSRMAANVDRFTPVVCHPRDASCSADSSPSAEEVLDHKDLFQSRSDATIETQCEAGINPDDCSVIEDMPKIPVSPVVEEKKEKTGYSGNWFYDFLKSFITRR